VLYGVLGTETVLLFLRLETIQEEEKIHFSFPESAWVISSLGVLDHPQERQPGCWRGSVVVGCSSEE